jgi:hypothetical protein
VSCRLDCGVLSFSSVVVALDCFVVVVVGDVGDVGDADNVSGAGVSVDAADEMV